MKNLSKEVNKASVANRALDKMDIQILQLLQEDGRMSYKSIADVLNTTLMTVTRRVAQMKKAGVIKKFSVVVNPEAVGRNYSICLFIQLDNPTAMNEVSTALSEHKDLCYIHHVTGEFEIAAMARCRDKEEASKLIERVGSIKGVVKVTPHSVLKTIKEDLDIELP
jgi:DNA-binding Lrp family transcriptional regulator